MTTAATGRAAPLEVVVTGPGLPPHLAPAVRALRHEVFVVGQGVPPALEHDALDPRCDHAVAVADGVVVGTGRLLPPELLGRDDEVAVVGRMAVAAGARGRGTGAAVLRALEDRAQERGLGAVELHAQVHARGFYDRAGYRVQGPVYLEAGIEHVTMRRPVGPGAVPDEAGVPGEAGPVGPEGGVRRR